MRWVSKLTIFEIRILNVSFVDWDTLIQIAPPHPKDKKNIFENGSLSSNCLSNPIYRVILFCGKWYSFEQFQIAATKSYIYAERRRTSPTP